MRIARIGAEFWSLKDLRRQAYPGKTLAYIEGESLNIRPLWALAAMGEELISSSEYDEM